MTNQERQRIAEGLEAWIKSLRDEWSNDDSTEIMASEIYYQLDEILGQIRDAAVEGRFPWEAGLGE